MAIPAIRGIIRFMVQIYVCPGFGLAGCTSINNCRIVTVQKRGSISPSFETRVPVVFQ
jgi:hypothetical protein